jgi:UDP-N-acetyl-2-amino-2-deoxyglucuronate dehydrogenase
MVKIAILGAGRVAEHYKKLFLSGKIINGNIVGVCDIDLAKAKMFAVGLTGNVYADYREMVNDLSPEIVFVLTPSGLHFEHAKSLLELNKHILVEKPLCMLPDQIDTLRRMAESKNLFLGVAFQNRFNTAILAAKNVYDSGRLGKIITATVRLRWCRFQDYYNDGWHGTWKMDGGVINQQAIHHVDALNWIVGPISSVAGTIANRINLLEAEDTLVAAVRFKNGALGTIEATTAARPEDYEASLSIVAENGLIEIGGVGLNEIIKWKVPGEDESNAKSKFSQKFENGYGVSHIDLINMTIEQLKNKKVDPLISAKHAYETSRVVHSLYASAELNKWVKIDENINSALLGI